MELWRTNARHPQARHNRRSQKVSATLHGGILCLGKVDGGGLEESRTYMAVRAPRFEYLVRALNALFTVHAFTARRSVVRSYTG